jgi:hypothetical protein
MDRDVITHGGQALRLLDDGVRVLVAQQNEGDFCHYLETQSLEFLPIVRIDSVKN